MCVESIGMIDTGGHVIFKRGKKYAAILMARVALEVIVLSCTSAVNVDRSITLFLVVVNALPHQLLPIRMPESLDKGTSKTPIHK
jgi:hypothetical protein